MGVRPQNTRSTVFPVNRPTEITPCQALTYSRITAGSQQPVIDAATGVTIYFQTPRMADGIHKIDVVVTEANEASQFVLDYFLITPNTGGYHSEVETSSSPPSSTPTSSGLPIVTTQSTLVGTILGGVVGGTAGIVILALALLWYFLRKRPRDDQAYYFEKSTPEYILDAEGP